MKKIIISGLLCTVLLSWTNHLIELEKKKIFDDKVEILLPREFGIMPEKMLKLKYPSQNRPTLVYSDENGAVNIAFNHTSSNATQGQLESYKTYFISTFKSVYPTAVWEEDGIKEINGRKVGFIKVTTPAIDTKVFNFLFFTDFEGRLLICTFNCTVEKKSEWIAAADKIFNSLTIK